MAFNSLHKYANTHATTTTPSSENDLLIRGEKHRLVLEHVLSEYFCGKGEQIFVLTFTHHSIFQVLIILFINLIKIHHYNSENT